MKDGLTLRDNAKADLIQIKSIEEGVTYLNKLESVAVWVMKEKKDAELSNLVAEQKLRTQRILGELIKQGQANGEIKTQATAKSSAAQELDDVGLTKKQSSTFKQIADIPEPEFEKFIEEKKAAVNNAVKELTTSGAVRLAKSLKEKQEDLDTLSDVNARLDIGVPAYLEFREFMQSFPELTFQACERIATGLISGVRKGTVSGHQAQMHDFQQGKLNIPNIHLSYKNARKVMDFKDYYDGFNRGVFVSAILPLFKSKKYDHKEMIYKLGVAPIRLTHCQNVEQYRLLLEKIYNWKRRDGKVSFRYE